MSATASGQQVNKAEALAAKNVKSLFLTLCD